MEAMTITQALANGTKGLFYGNRLLLPFKADFLKIIIDDKIILDFSVESEYLEINEDSYFTDIYFLEEENLRDVVSKYETIKMVVVEKHESLFELNNHKKLVLSLEEPHFVNIAIANDDLLFIE